MKITVLGGAGAFPTATQACSGYLVEQDGFRVLVDPGYATVPRLQAFLPVAAVDAVLVSHQHPDHCADLNPLLRARAMADEPVPALPVWALPGALDAVLALDNPRTLAGAYTLHSFAAGDRFDVGPFQVDTRLLPHWVPNAGMRLRAGGAAVAYTGDTGPSPDVVALARGADLLLAEATHLEQQSDPIVSRYLSTARQAAAQAAEAGVGRLVLTHLWPGTDPAAAAGIAATAYSGPIDVARPDLVIEV